MKAKEYFFRYEQEGKTNLALMRVCNDMIKEIPVLASSRNVKTPGALLSIIDEIDNKWRAFVRLCNDDGINPDGFKSTIKKVIPDIEVLSQYRDAVLYARRR